MAAITAVAPIPVVVSGYEVVDYGLARDDMKAGDPVVIDATPAPANNRWTCATRKATSTFADGICLKDVKAGGVCEFGVQGEMDGFADLTPGTHLTIVDGKIDDTPATGAYQIIAVNATRIRFNFV